MSDNYTANVEVGPDLEVEISPTYEPHYPAPSEACNQARIEADQSSDEAVESFFNLMSGDGSFQEFGENLMDAWGDAQMQDDICDSGPSLSIF